MIHRTKLFWPLYVMAIPGIVFLIVFKYIPLAGYVSAFQNYSVFKGFLDSPWVGFKNFETLFHDPDFIRVFSNTLVLGLLRIGSERTYWARASDSVRIGGRVTNVN